MKIPQEAIVIDDRKIPTEKKHRAFIKPGTKIESNDAKRKYLVMPNGEWRRVKK